MKKYSISLIFSAFLLTLFLSPINAFAANYYFTNAEDGEWSNVNNWWSDQYHTTPAGGLPGPTDDAYVDGNVLVAGTISLSNLYIGGINGVDGSIQSGNFTVSGSVYVGQNTIGLTETYITSATISANNIEFYNNSYINDSTLTGTVSFSDDSYIGLFVTINGDVTFSGFSTNMIGSDSVINGTVNFYTTAYCSDESTINGEAYFYSESISSCLGTAGNVRYHYFNSETASLVNIQDYVSNGYAWTIVADGVQVDLSGATIDSDSESPTYTTLSEINGGSFILSSASIPTISTSTPTNISTTSITLNGLIVDDGGASTTDRGFNWGTTISYGNTASTTETLGTNDTFSENVSGLTCNTTYHYRAFATNSEGTATTSDSTFTTSACPTPDPEPEPEPTPTPSSSGSSGSRARNTSIVPTTPIYVPNCPSGFVCTPVQPITAPIQTPTTNQNNFTRSLTIGNTGSDVKSLQQYLNSKGFFVAISGPGSPGNETEKFGALTRSALARFQSANGISPAIGFFGPITRSFIQNKK